MKGTQGGRPHRGGRTQRNPKTNQRMKKKQPKQWCEALFEKEDYVVRRSYWIWGQLSLSPCKQKIANLSQPYRQIEETFNSRETNCDGAKFTEASKLFSVLPNSKVFPFLTKVPPHAKNTAVLTRDLYFDRNRFWQVQSPALALCSSLFLHSSFSPP